MAEISAALVKQLREKTGAGMMECKKALDEAAGDLEKAVEILRKRGIASASKKAARAARQGIVGTHIADSGKLGVLVEVNCESDFVARTDDFQNLVRDLAEQIAVSDPADVQTFLAESFSKQQGATVGQHVAATIGKIGENIVLARFARFAVDGSDGVIGQYIHHGGQLGVLVEFLADTSEVLGREDVQEVVRDVAMQIAAADPQCLGRENVSPELLAKEKDIARERARQEGKPEKILDKIVEGRMAKFYEEVCLLEQPFIKDNSMSVGQLIGNAAKSGGNLRIGRFARFKVGETATSEEQPTE
jgi:elongation factor Ts